jgi:hypothetical protein
MKLQRSIITTTTPQVVTTVQTVTGKVWHVTPPNSVILRLENNSNQSFKIPNGRKFNVNGEMVDAFGLKRGMIVTATNIVEVPEVVVSQQKHVTGTMPAPLSAPPDCKGRAHARARSRRSPCCSGSNEDPAENGERTASDWSAWAFCLTTSLGVKFLRANISV